MHDQADRDDDGRVSAAQAARALTMDLHSGTNDSSAIATRLMRDAESASHFTERDRSALRQNHAVPLYHQIGQIIRTYIKSSTFGYGSYLPSDNRLAGIFGVSRVTATRALRELAREGLIERRRGDGNLVVYEPPKMAGLQLNADPFGHHDVDVAVRVITCERRRPPISIAMDMPTSILAEAHFVARVLLNESAAFCYQESWIAGLPENTRERQLRTVEFGPLLAKSGIRITEAKYSLTASTATMATMDSLGMAFGDPVLCVTRRAHNQHGQVVEISVFQYHGDSFQMVSP